MEKVKIVVLLLLLALPCFVSAAPIYNFKFTLTVDEIIQGCDPESDQIGFGCELSVGDKWHGFFQISVNPMDYPDGGLSTPFVSMRLITGNAIWDHCVLNGLCEVDEVNQLIGYRDVVGPEYFNTLGPGFNLLDGAITGFSGGFFGDGDASFIDFDYFFSEGAGRFSALDDTNQAVRGSYVITRITEPSTTNFLVLFICYVFLRKTFLKSK
ncbi:hypothetical protein [Rheinheimera pacifica]|uniref:hypothetical protein n=1 Tax=Rheinheimera pacifica TaxID=173990 RepID=UPI002ED81CB0